MIDRPLSWSMYQKYLDCPQLYKYHIDGLRPESLGSALVFGIAVDDMINALLDVEFLGGHGDPWEAFNASFDVNQLIDWDKDDYDGDLIDKNSVLTVCKKAGYKGSNLDHLITSLFKKIKSGESLSVGQQACLTEACAATLREKAKLFLKGYRKWVLPQIEEVEVVQKKIVLANGKILGIADYVARIKGQGRCLLDNKTSKRSYDRDAVKTAGQLVLYAKALGCEKAGFVVMVKNISKNAKYICEDCNYDEASHQHKSCPNEIDGSRCKGNLNKTVKPKAFVQVLIDDVNIAKKDMVEKALLDVHTLMQTGVYPRNLNACKWMYGKPCPYINKCWHDSNKGLKEKKRDPK